MAKKMKWFDWLAISLLIIGGVNWGLDVFGWSIFNWMPNWVDVTVKSVVALSAIYSVYALRKVF